MSLFDFFFPEQAQATHLRTLAEQQRRNQLLARSKSAQSARRSDELEQRVSELEHDLGFVTLVLGSILETLENKGTVTREELKNQLDELDSIDGVSDGKLDINILRGRTQ